MKDFFLRILTIIGYSDDKDKHAEELTELCNKELFVNLLASLPEDKQQAIRSELPNISTEDTAKKVLLSHFTPEQYTQIFQQTLEKFLGDYVQSIAPTLTAAQSEELVAFFKLYSPQVAK